MNIQEIFDKPELPQGFYWFNEPKKYELDNGLILVTKPETDFWQRSHYGFRRDDGHCLLTKIEGDFCITTRVIFEPQSQYDQCGLMVRLDEENWIKTSTEYENESVSRLGTVATNLGYSDWATQDISSSTKEMWYRISKKGQDYLLESSFDGVNWRQMRVTHLHLDEGQVQAGVYACSPIGSDFWCKFLVLRITGND